jgi:hypothetical protein
MFFYKFKEFPEGPTILPGVKIGDGTIIEAKASLRLSEKYPKHKQCAMIILLWPDINTLINPGDYS